VDPRVVLLLKVDLLGSRRINANNYRSEPEYSKFKTDLYIGKFENTSESAKAGPSKSIVLYASIKVGLNGNKSELMHHNTSLSLTLDITTKLRSLTK